jgi:serine/threonine-protein kinase
VRRFKHEAQIVAALNHPNIAAIYGFEDDGGLQALALELVEGATLADLIARGPVPADEAIPIARQIAEALEAAHEQGIVHRDLKPSNVAVRADGAVKVLDFGIARVVADDAGNTTAPTSTAMAPSGALLGTPAYMSPEQAKGRAGDKRSDIWAFGAVLFEMLAGQRAFAGAGAHDTLAAVVQGDVEWHRLPVRTPETLRYLIARCLTRDPRHRLRDIGEARIALGDTNPIAESIRNHDVIAPSRARWTRRLVVAAAVVVTGVVAAALAWNLKPPPTPRLTRFALAYPEGQVPAAGIGRHFFALSPDGTRIAYAAIPPGLYLRPMSAFTPSLIQGTQGNGRVAEPVFSPDGRSIAFYADGAIRRILAVGGSAVTLAKTAAPYGMNWGPDGLVFGAGQDGIMRVSADGGTPEVIAPVGAGEEAHGPQVLPGGQHLLFTIATGTSLDRWNAARIVVDSLASGTRATLIDGGTDARYLPTGHLVYARGDVLYAVSFDAQRLRVTSAPVAMVNGIGSALGQTGSTHFAVADTGVLAYQPRSVNGITNAGEKARLAFIDRTGQTEPLTIPPAMFVTPRISPDGTHIAFGTDDGVEAIIWIHDRSRPGQIRRLTFGGNNRFPVWSADGVHVTFQSDRAGRPALFWQLADGSGTAERLTMPDAETSHVPESWSPGGDALLYSVETEAVKSLWVLSRRKGTTKPFGDIQSALPIGAAFSPDGRWVAYAVSETTFVQPFPPTGAIYQLVTSGFHPAWSHDGGTLFFNPRPQGMGVVSVTTTPTFAFGTPTVEPRPFALSPPEFRRAYDIAPDGRFLAVVIGQAGSTALDTSPLRVVLNWFEELRAQVRPDR